MDTSGDSITREKGPVVAADRVGKLQDQSRTRKTRALPKSPTLGTQGIPLERTAGLLIGSAYHLTHADANHAARMARLLLAWTSPHASGAPYSVFACRTFGSSRHFGQFILHSCSCLPTRAPLSLTAKNGRVLGETRKPRKGCPLAKIVFREWLSVVASAVVPRFSSASTVRGTRPDAAVDRPVVERAMARFDTLPLLPIMPNKKSLAHGYCPVFPARACVLPADCPCTPRDQASRVHPSQWRQAARTAPHCQLCCRGGRNHVPPRLSFCTGRNRDPRKEEVTRCPQF